MTTRILVVGSQRVKSWIWGFTILSCSVFDSGFVANVEGFMFKSEFEIRNIIMIN